jgi:hypothetical protein
VVRGTIGQRGDGWPESELVPGASSLFYWLSLTAIPVDFENGFQ